MMDLDFKPGDLVKYNCSIKATFPSLIDSLGLFIDYKYHGGILMGRVKWFYIMWESGTVPDLDSLRIEKLNCLEIST